MSEIKLFLVNNTVEEKVETSPSSILEKSLQTLIENNMETFFGVRFLKSEYKISNGRMDSIGIDENNCPVIFEYKRNLNENVINQGLFYLDWLLDHKAEFKLLVLEKLGQKAADNIDWSVPCVICVAHNFTRYDEHAVKQMQRNIKLVCYRKYDDLILFEHINTPNTTPIVVDDNIQTPQKQNQGNINKSHIEKLDVASNKIKILYSSICEYIEALGDDIVSNQLKKYLAYKKVQNFACIEIHTDNISIFLKLNPDNLTIEKGFTRDMRNIGHYGTGDLQVIIKNDEDFDKAKPLIEKAYNEN